MEDPRGGVRGVIPSRQRLMEDYIKDLCYVIKNGDMENTYKMVWIRSIVETCVLEPDTRTIKFDQLSHKIFGYCNQTIYFDLGRVLTHSKDPKYTN